MTPRQRFALPKVPEIDLGNKRLMAASDREALLVVQMEELRHRLRNHLQNMTSLISMQVRRARHPEAVAALEDLRVRFASLTSIYIDLDNAIDQPTALEKFVPDLVRRIGELYDPAACHRSRFDIVPLTLDGHRAALLGQIVVELTMNVYRHAFEGRTGGVINVALRVADGDAVLTIADDGPGFREPDAARKHFGITIVKGLAKGLNGSFERESNNGLQARVRFPVSV